MTNLLAALALLLVGITVLALNVNPDAGSFQRSERDHCLKTATTGYEIKQCQ